jgi:phage shock protein B
MSEIFIVPVVMGTLFLGLPWLILHYLTKWRSTQTLTGEDERLLDEMYETARRLEARLHTVERIVKADNPHFQPSEDESTMLLDQFEQRINSRRN